MANPIYSLEEINPYVLNDPKHPNSVEHKLEELKQKKNKTR